MRSRTIPALLALLIAVAATGAGAQPVKPRGIELRALTPLSFGSFANSVTGGQVSVAPDGTRTVTGVVPLGADSFGPATFEVRVSGSGNPNYSITLPATITLTGPGGSMTIASVQSFPAGSGNAKPPGRVDTLTVGGTLTINAGQAAGAYAGQFPVTVNLVN